MVSVVFSVAVTVITSPDWNGIVGRLVDKPEPVGPVMVLPPGVKVKTVV